MSLNERMKNVLMGKGRKTAGRRKVHSLLGRAARTTVDSLEARRLLSASPVANPGGPYNVNEGQSLVVDGGASTDDVGVVAYAWDLNYKVSKGFRRTLSGQAFTFDAEDGNATRTIALRVTDADGQINLQTTTINIHDVAPTVTLVGTSTANEGQPYSLAWSSTDPGQDTISGYSIDWGDGVTTTHTAAESSTTHTYAEDDSYTISFTAIDEDGSHVTTKALTVNNVVPIINASLQNSTINEGDTARVSFSSPNRQSSIDQWIVDWGDDTVNVRPARATNSTHTYADNGNYTVTVTALEDDGTATDHTLSLVVNNVAPSVTLGGVPDESPEGTAITATHTSPADAGVNDTFNYAWELKKDSTVIATSATTGNYTFTPTDNGNYTLKLTVTDNDGDADVKSKSFTVTNVAPTGAVTATIPSPFNEGSTVTFTSTISDVGSADTHTRDWRVEKDGETLALGATPHTGATFDFTPADEGSYVVSCLITDDDGGQYIASYSSTITVVNVDPTASVTGGVNANEGDTQTLNANAADAGANDVLSYSWSVTKGGAAYTLPGSVATNAATLVFVPNDNDTYVASVTVTDGDGGTVSSSSSSFSVANVNPTAAITAPATGLVEGSVLNFTVAPHDAGSADTFAYAWTVAKNGAPFDVSAETTNTASFHFTPDNEGSYVVTVVVTDDDGGSVTQATSPIVVANAAPTATISAAPVGAVEGDTISLTSTHHDAGAADTISYLWTVTKNAVSYTLPPGTVDNTANFDFVADDDGAYVVTLTVTDDAGDSSTATRALTVINSAPVGTITGVVTPLDEGGTISLGVSVADAGVHDTFTYLWSVAKGGSPVTLDTLLDVTSSTFSYVTPDNGSYVVSCKVTDNAGAQHIADSGTIVVNNVAPTATITGAPGSAVDEGSTQTFTAHPADAGTADTFSYAWTVTKDSVSYTLPGGVATNASTFAFAPNDNGAYIVNCTVTDDDGGNVVVHSSTFTVSNVAPTITASGPTTGTEGSALAFTSTVVDPGTVDTQSYLWSVTRNGVSYNTGAAVATNANFTFTPADDGTYVVHVVVTDNDSGVGSANAASVVVANVAPTATISAAPVGAFEGDTISFTSTHADAGVNDSIAYLWTVTKDGASYTLPGGTVANTSAFNFVAVDNGAYVVRLTVTDGTDSSFVTRAFNVANSAPIGTITGAVSPLNEGATIALGVSVADAGALDTFTYQWAVEKNGQPVTLGGGVNVTANTFSYVTPDNGSYVVSCKVTDNDGAQHIASSGAIIVNNVAPTATVSGTPSGSVNEGATQSFTATPADVGSADTFTYAWTVTKDSAPYTLPGSVATNASTFAFAPNDNGTYIVNCVVSDDDSGTVTVHSGTFTVLNVAPVATVTGAATGTEGTAMTFSSTSSDAGTADTQTYAWTVTRNGVSYNTGTAVTTGANLTFTPDDNGTFVASLVVTDDDGGAVTANSGAAVVANVAPSVTITGGPTHAIAEGSNVTVGTTVTDPGVHDTQTYAWSVTRDGVAYDLTGVTTNTPGFSFDANDNGTYVLSLTVTDNDGGSRLVTKTINVTNANPLATFSSATAGPIAEGSSASYTVDASDPSPVDVLSYAWQVTRNGAVYTLPNTVATTNSTFTFAPTLSGSYVVSETTSDNDGGSTTITRPLTVTNVAPVVNSISGPTGTVSKNAALTYTAAVTDPGEESITYNWQVAKGGVVLATGTNASFQYTPTRGGDYQVYCSVSDGIATSNLRFVEFSVTNHAPTVSAITGTAGHSETDSFTLGTTASDADNDALTYAWTITRSGQTMASGNNATLTYTAPRYGQYVATVVVSDGETTTTQSSTFVVTDVAPTGSIATVTGAIEGSPVTFTGTGNDVGADTLHFDWYVYRDGATNPTWIGQSFSPITPGGQSTFTFTPDAPGNYSVKLAVTDTSGIPPTNITQSFTVANDIPTAHLLVPSLTGVIGWDQSFSLEDLIKVPSDSVSVDWNFGDGTAPLTAQNGTATVTHKYAETGLYTLTATLHDDDGGTSVATGQLQVYDYGLQPDPMGSGTALVVIGNEANDSIAFSQNSSGKIKAVRNGVTLGSNFSVTRIFANGDSGQNKIEANTNVTIPVVFTGGSSKDTLIGGSGNDILIGRRGNDSLTGNGGRDFLIGGLDSDTLNGSAGDDIMVGGSQVSSESYTSLAAIMNEWTNTSRSLTTRVSRLKNGAEGLLAYFATGNVIGDGKVDTLTGGTDADWMFKDLGSATDTIVDATSIDRVESVNA